MGVQGVIGNVGSDLQRYSPSLVVGHLVRPSATGAIYFSGGVDYNYGTAPGYRGQTEVSHRFAAFAGAAALLQATPVLALRVSGGVAQFKYVDDYHSSIDDTYRELSAGAALLVSASPTVDVSPYVGYSSIDKVDKVDGYGAGLSIAIRSR